MNQSPIFLKGSFLIPQLIITQQGPENVAGAPNTIVVPSRQDFERTRSQKPAEFLGPVDARSLEKIMDCNDCNGIHDYHS